MKAPRPKRLAGATYELDSSCGPVYVTCNDHEGRLFEVFAKLGKGGGCSSAVTEAVGVAVSIGLRSGTDPAQVVKGLVGIGCHKQFSCIDAIGQAMREHLEVERG